MRRDWLSFLRLHNSASSPDAARADPGCCVAIASWESTLASLERSRGTVGPPLEDAASRLDFRGGACVCVVVWMTYGFHYTTGPDVMADTIALYEIRPCVLVANIPMLLAGLSTSIVAEAYKQNFSSTGAGRIRKL